MTTITSPDHAALPTHPADGSTRAVSIDVARGLAMLGMVSVHVAWTNRGWWSTLASGRAAVLFFVLSGVTVSMLSQRSATTASPTQLRRRGVVLLLGGITMMSTIWSTTILHVYGAMFVVAPLLLRRRSRTLVVATALAVGAGPVAIVLWDDVHIAFGNAVVTPSIYFFVRRLFTDHFALFVWAGFFIAGILTGRLGLSRRRTALGLAAAGALAAIGANLAHYLWATAPRPPLEAADGIDWSGLWSIEPHANTAPWALQSLGISLAVIGLLSAAPSAVLRPLRPIGILGSMTLSAYIVHTFLVQDVWGWFIAGDPVREFVGLGAICAVLIVGAVLIDRRWGKGPFERGLSWLVQPAPSSRRNVTVRAGLVLVEGSAPRPVGGEHPVGR